MIQESSPDCSSTTGQNALDQMQAFFFFFSFCQLVEHLIRIKKRFMKVNSDMWFSFLLVLWLLRSLVGTSIDPWWYIKNSDKYFQQVVAAKLAYLDPSEWCWRTKMVDDVLNHDTISRMSAICVSFSINWTWNRCSIPNFVSRKYFLLFSYTTPFLQVEAEISM